MTDTSTPTGLPELLALADALGLTDVDLDESVHQLRSEAASQAVNDGADYDETHDSASLDASAINNGGIESQIGFLLSSCGAEWVRAHLHQLAAGA